MSAETCLACAAAKAAAGVVDAPNFVRLSQAWLLGCASGVRADDVPIRLCDEHARDFLHVLKAMTDALDVEEAAKGPPS